MSPEYQPSGQSTRTEDAPRPILAGRLATGMSQEAMADALHIDQRTLRRYETGELRTPDDIMLKMATTFGRPALLYRHFKEKYEIPDEMMPAVEPVPLSMAVVSLLYELERLEKAGIASELLKLAADGKIDPDEKADFDFIMSRLDGVVEAVARLRYSRKE